MYFIAEELRIMAQLGFRTLKEMVDNKIECKINKAL
jgi:glutamate synthase domain-containing protein 2